MNSGYIAQLVSKLDNTDAFTLGVMCGGLAIYGVLIVVRWIEDVAIERRRRRDFVEWAGRNGIELAPPPTLWQQYAQPLLTAVSGATVSALVWLALRDITPNR